MNSDMDSEYGQEIVYEWVYAVMLDGEVDIICKDLNVLKDYFKMALNITITDPNDFRIRNTGREVKEVQLHKYYGD